jgi:dTDP-4-amino-4,6-dideoxygalactose transaminase
MDQISPIAKAHELVIIEDAAQALGASLNGTRAGAFGAAGCFSFYPAKLLGAYGDAGAAVANDTAIADTVRLLRDHGRTPDGDIAFWSFNSRMDNLHAVMLDYKLARLDEAIERRRELAAAYHAQLGHLAQLLLPPPPVEESAYYDVFQNFEIECERRDDLRAALTDAGVETLIQWGGKGVHQFQALGLTHFELPRTELMFERSIMLPMHPELSDDDVTYVCDVIRRFYQ